MPLHADLLVSPKIRLRIRISRMLPTVVVKTIFRHRSDLCPRRERKRRQLGIRLLRLRVPLSMLKILLSRLRSALTYLPPPQRAFTLRTCEFTFSSSLFVSRPDCTTSSVLLPRQKPLLLLFLLTMQTGPQLAPPICCIPVKMDRPRLSSLSPKLSIFLRAQLYSAYIASLPLFISLLFCCPQVNHQCHTVQGTSALCERHCRTSRSNLCGKIQAPCHVAGTESLCPFHDAGICAELPPDPADYHWATSLQGHYCNSLWQSMAKLPGVPCQTIWGGPNAWSF